MKFTCDKNSIQREITIAQEIISSRNAISILSNVLLEADDNTLVIKATDLKVGFKTSIPVEVVRPGSTTIFCDKFLGILRSLPDGDIEFELEDNRFYVRPLFKKIDFQLKSISSDNFPELQETNNENYFEVSQNDLNEMINQTIFAVSDDDTRYFLNGVYLENSEGNLTMVATDSRRLSMISKQTENSIHEFNPVIVPPKILQLIRKLSSGEGNISLAISENNIFIKMGNQQIFSNLIDGHFPDYRRVIPKEQEYELHINRLEFIEALRRVSLLVENRSRRIYLKMTEGSLTIFSEESDMGEAKEELVCQYEGPELEIGLNYLYLMEPLKAIDSEDVTLKFSDPGKAFTLYSKPEENYLHIIMPMTRD